MARVQPISVARLKQRGNNTKQEPQAMMRSTAADPHMDRQSLILTSNVYRLTICTAASFVILFSIGVDTAAPEDDWPPGASDYRIHVVGQGHLDAVWLWPWYESLSEAHSTFRTVLDLMQEEPEFTFTAASSQFYVWIEENDPEMLQEIRSASKRDAGGWQADGGSRLTRPCRAANLSCARDSMGSTPCAVYSAARRISVITPMRRAIPLPCRRSSSSRECVILSLRVPRRTR